MSLGSRTSDFPIPWDSPSPPMAASIGDLSWLPHDLMSSCCFQRDSWRNPSWEVPATVQYAEGATLAAAISSPMIAMKLVGIWCGIF